MKKSTLRIIWLAVLAASLLACNFLSGLGDQVGEARSTAQSAATLVEGAQGLAATGQALATQLAGSDLAQTAQALATQVDQAGLDETAQAMASEAAAIGLDETAQAIATQVAESGLEETAQAFITQNAPGMVETAQAMVTNQGAGLVETAQALATQAAAALGQAPAEIPIVPGDKDNYSASGLYVSYTTPLSFAEVLDFYKREMVNEGWNKVDLGSVETETSAILNYEKPDRKAAVVLETTATPPGTIVAITVQSK